MKCKNNNLLLCQLILPVALVSCARQSPVNQKPNILFIVIDDMNDWTTVFDSGNPIKTPNIAELAKSGAFFTRAYCPSPACNPSRSSVLTGTRPHTTGIYGNSSDWKAALPGTTTLQKYFRNNGYFIGGSGKIFHHHNDWAFHDNASFHEYLMMSVNEPYPDKKLNGLEWYGSRNTDWGPWPDDIRKTADHRTMEYAVRFLERKHDQPFMLNVGIYKPHSPWFVPEEYFTRYPEKELSLPVLKADDRSDLPPGAATLAAPTRWFWEGMTKALEENPEAFRDFVQAYQACAGFADEMVGKIISALNRSPYKNNTIIILWSDNGFHLGEKDHIEKFALWEKTTHVPYIIVAPGITKPGQVINHPVDLTTIYPTLVELCGFEVPQGVEGLSLVPLLEDPSVKVPPALMTYLKGNHAIRTEKWRYILYADGTEELYDHDNDPNEWNNLAGEENYRGIMDDLKKYIPDENAEQVKDLEK